MGAGGVLSTTDFVKAVYRFFYLYIMFIMNMKTHMLHSRDILNKNEVISIKTGLNRVCCDYFLSQFTCLGGRTTFNVIMTILII